MIANGKSSSRIAGAVFQVPCSFSRESRPMTGVACAQLGLDRVRSAVAVDDLQRLVRNSSPIGGLNVAVDETPANLVR